MYALLLFMTISLEYSIMLSFSLKPNYKNDLMFNLRPPNTIENNNNNNDENGYRLLTSKECDSVVKLWKRKIGILNNTNKIELYEMLNLIEDCSKVMPGKQPHRRELLAFGEFQQGEINCILLGYLIKVQCPWDFDILAIVQLQPDHHIDLMIEFVNEVCIEHACVPNYHSLNKWNIFDDKKFMNRSINNNNNDDRNNEIILLYQQINLSPCMILDDHNIPDISTCWFKTKLNHNTIPHLSIDIYWRQKRSSTDEFEIRFLPPISGVSSGYGTVGCHVIIDTDNTNINMNSFGINQQASEYIKYISKEIKTKILHPSNI